MNQDEIKVIILEYINKEYLEDSDEEITFNTPLISGGYVDSFSMISLLVFIENKFNIKIPPSKATPEAFDSIDRIVDLINEHLT